MRIMRQCPQCQMTFRFSFELTKHLADVHGINGDTQIVSAAPPVLMMSDLPTLPNPANAIQQAADQEQSELMARFEEKIEVLDSGLIVATNGNGLFIPTANPHYFIERDKLDKLARNEEMSKLEPQCIGLKGPTGAGKTSLGLQFAAVYQRLTYIMNCGAMARPDQWFGSMGANESGTYFQIAEFIKALETPRSCIIFDEMNRVENPKVLNPLIGLLDESQFQVFIDEIGRWVHIAPGVVFFATINEGWEYQGTDPIDTALGRRFEWMTMKYPPREQLVMIMMNRSTIKKTDAELISNFAAGLAAHDKEPIFIDTRQLIKMAKHVAFGASIRDAFEYTFAAGLKASQFEKAMGALQQLLRTGFDKATPAWMTWA